LATFKSRLARREDVILLWWTCVFLVFIWAFFKLFNQIPSLILRFDLAGVIGVCAYVLAFALLESILFFLVVFVPFYALSLFLPSRWLQVQWGVLASLAALLAAVFVMLYQRDPGLWSLVGPRHRLLYLGMLGLACLVSYVLLLRFPKLADGLRSALQKVSILSMLYAGLGGISLFIVIIRNIL
jgi:hypothetical protein